MPASSLRALFAALCTMNKTDAINKIQKSLISEKPQVITPEGQVYEEYIEKLSVALLESVIEPVKVNVISSCAADGDLEKYQASVVWGIAKCNGNWLLTLEAENEFALGFGSDPKQIMIHGFSSSDALGEWCA
tara:strand:+ start:713 stop:1111 length:399 start_codon:yes stop_codon:yes gene_type:complete